MYSYAKSSSKSTRAALLAALSAGAVLLVGCGSSTTSESTGAASESPSPTTEATAAPAPEKVSAKGRVDSLAGSTVLMTVTEGPARVAITPTTRVLQITPAQFADIKPGSCVDLRRPAPTPDGQQGPASSIMVSAAASNGTCPDAVAEKRVRGSVAAVDGQTISVANASQPEPTAVTVDPGTKYTKQAAVSQLVITPGACLSAVGILDSGGVLQAASATVSPLVDGACPGA
jgi:hypothetical protein